MAGTAPPPLTDYSTYTLDDVVRVLSSADPQTFLDNAQWFGRVTSHLTNLAPQLAGGVNKLAGPGGTWIGSGAQAFAWIGNLVATYIANTARTLNSPPHEQLLRQIADALTRALAQLQTLLSEYSTASTELENSIATIDPKKYKGPSPDSLRIDLRGQADDAARQILWQLVREYEGNGLAFNQVGTGPEWQNGRVGSPDGAPPAPVYHKATAVNGAPPPEPITENLMTTDVTGQPTVVTLPGDTFGSGENPSGEQLFTPPGDQPLTLSTGDQQLVVPPPSGEQLVIDGSPDTTLTDTGAETQLVIGDPLGVDTVTSLGVPGTGIPGDGLTLSSGDELLNGTDQPLRGTDQQVTLDLTEVQPVGNNLVTPNGQLTTTAPTPVFGLTVPLPITGRGGTNRRRDDRRPSRNLELDLSNITNGAPGPLGIGRPGQDQPRPVDLTVPKGLNLTALGRLEHGKQRLDLTVSGRVDGTVRGEMSVLGRSDLVQPTPKVEPPAITPRIEPSTGTGLRPPMGTPGIPGMGGMFSGTSGRGVIGRNGRGMPNPLPLGTQLGKKKDEEKQEQRITWLVDDELEWQNETVSADHRVQPTAESPAPLAPKTVIGVHAPDVTGAGEREGFHARAAHQRIEAEGGEDHERQSQHVAEGGTARR